MKYKFYPIKVAWNSIRQHRDLSQVDRLVWNGLVLLKISFSAWWLVRNPIPLEVTLKKFGIPCCRLQEESWRHLFITGPIALQVWTHFRKRFGIIESTFSSVLSLLLSWFSSSSVREVKHIRVVVPVVVLLWQPHLPLGRTPRVSELPAQLSPGLLGRNARKPYQTRNRTSILSNKYRKSTHSRRNMHLN